MILKIKPLNETYVEIECSERNIEYELKNYLTYKAENYYYSPLYKKNLWDGNISLFSVLDKTLYKGLIYKVKDFCRERGYTCIDGVTLENKDFTYEDAQNFSSILNLPFEARDYQLKAFTQAIRYRRSLLLSPTSSGKSLIMYLIARYFHDKDILVIVPNTSLVEQLYKDFENYGFDSASNIQRIYANQKDGDDKRIVISTWQSVHRRTKAWFKRFSVIMVDEAHLAKAKSLIGIMKKCDHIVYRYGLTGTLSKVKLNNYTLEGLFGQIYKVITTTQLIENKTISDISILGITLKYPESFSAKMEYHDELKFLFDHEKRNKFVAMLALNLQRNCLILYNQVDAHGKILFNLLNELNEKNKQKQIYFISGDVKTEERERVRELCEKNDNVIVVASYGTYSTGVNIVNLHNIIFSSPTKSKIRSLQSIGRGLRKGNGKVDCKLYDIGDYLYKTNYAYKHFRERLLIYKDEQFKITLKEVSL